MSVQSAQTSCFNKIKIAKNLLDNKIYLAFNINRYPSYAFLELLTNETIILHGVNFRN